MLKSDHSVNNTLDSVGLGVKFLLCRNKSLVGYAMLIFGWFEDDFKPLCYVFDGSFAIVLNFIHFFIQAIQIQKVGFYSLVYYLVQRVLFEIHRF